MDTALNKAEAQIALDAIHTYIGGGDIKYIKCSDEVLELINKMEEIINPAPPPYVKPIYYDVNGEECYQCFEDCPCMDCVCTREGNPMDV
tara:strand:- start:1799 stop:2068 length:270 start_codon:yes stop_codon:yes gene_type:complete